MVGSLGAVSLNPFGWSQPGIVCSVYTACLGCWMSSSMLSSLGWLWNRERIAGGGAAPSPLHPPPASFIWRAWLRLRVIESL